MPMQAWQPQTLTQQGFHAIFKDDEISLLEYLQRGVP